MPSSIRNILRNRVGNSSDLTKIIRHLDIKIGNFGGRRFTYKNTEDSLSLNQIVKPFSKLIPKLNLADTSGQQTRAKDLEVLAALCCLDAKANKRLEKASPFQKLMTRIKQFFGNLFYNRDKDYIKATSICLQTLGSDMDHSELRPGFSDESNKEKIDLFLKRIKDHPKAEIILHGVLNDIRNQHEQATGESEKKKYADLFMAILKEIEEQVLITNEKCTSFHDVNLFPTKALKEQHAIALKEMTQIPVYEFGVRYLAFRVDENLKEIELNLTQAKLDNNQMFEVLFEVKRYIEEKRKAEPNFELSLIFNCPPVGNEMDNNFGILLDELANISFEGLRKIIFKNHTQQVSEQVNANFDEIRKQFPNGYESKILTLK